MNGDAPDANGVAPPRRVRRRRRCPLCEMDVKPESALVKPSANAEVRSIMLIELQNRGIVPDRRIYRIMAQQYNERVVDVAREIGEHLRRWTSRDVRLHYERCLTMVPRLESARQYHSVTRIKRLLVLRELYMVNDDGVEVVNQKALDNYLKLEARASDLLKQHAMFLKSDLAQMEHALVPSAQNTAATGANNAGEGGGAFGTETSELFQC